MVSTGTETGQSLARKHLTPLGALVCYFPLDIPWAVRRYLDLKPGMELSSQRVATIEGRLWRSARFRSYKVSLGSPDAGGRVPLQIEVAEYDGAPPLDQAFSPTDQALLKLREWLSKLDESGEDVIATLSGFPAPAPEGELVLSPRSGLVLRA